MDDPPRPAWWSGWPNFAIAFAPLFSSVSRRHTPPACSRSSINCSCKLPEPPANAVPTIAYAAERLGLRHNSVVELANRSEEEGLLERTSDESDARRVLLRITSKGSRLLHKLAAHHRSELDVMGPDLIGALTRIEHWQDDPLPGAHSAGRTLTRGAR